MKPTSTAEAVLSNSLNNKSMDNVLFKKLCQTKTLLQAWKLVKQKGSIGGVDGQTIADVDANIDNCIKQLQQELLKKRWNPQPYLRIFIPKKNHERRNLGLLTIKDKIVQQAIKILIEPRFEKVFVKNSYGYRPDKGHMRAVKFARSCFQNKKYPFALKLDIDNYFDTINHDILFRRLQSVVPDLEILRLIELCTKMGIVNKRLKWDEITEGVAQGAILSPILANYYLHSFDQFVLSRTNMYVRYADDFIICCTSIEEATKILNEASLFLQDRLRLRLNEPKILEVKNGIEFLGITIDNRNLSISVQKKRELHQRIKELSWEERNFSKKTLKSLAGIKHYYATLLPESFLEEFDNVLITRLKEIINQTWEKIPNKTVLQSALKEIDFYANTNILLKGQIRGDLVNHYLFLRSQHIRKENQTQNKELIRKRKQEYRKREVEATELIISQQGTYIGVINTGITLKLYGKQQKLPPMSSLNHISILCNGVSISSNAIGYCMTNKITIDYFSTTGQHIASILSNIYMQTCLWNKQAMMTTKKRAVLAARIIYGKLKNQFNLIKYFHKYHKKISVQLCKKYEEIEPKFKSLIKNISSYNEENTDYKKDIMSIEAVGANLYWDYIRELISDDQVGFLYRERHGATDLVNCMLNYGYAILYTRVWQSLLLRKLNPTDSVLHEPNNGKPTFVYDVIELFRTQAVDRVVVSLIQKGESLKIQKGLLSEDSENSRENGRKLGNNAIRW